MDPIVISARSFSATPEELFRSFTDPDTLSRWWGPMGFTNTIQRFDLKPGGVWEFVMHAPDGTEYPMRKEIVEVVPFERIVLRHVQEGHSFTMTMSYEPAPSGTRLTWRMDFDKAEEAEAVRDLIQQANEQNFDRLEGLLSEMRRRPTGVRGP